MPGLRSIAMALRGDVCSLSAAGLAPAAAGTSAARPLEVQCSTSIRQQKYVRTELRLGADLRNSLFTAAAACAPLGMGADSLQLQLVSYQPRSGGGSGGAGATGSTGAACSTDAACNGGVLLSVCNSEGARLAQQPTTAQVHELLPGAPARIRERNKEERTEQRQAEAAAVMVPGSRTRGAKASRRGG